MKKTILVMMAILMAVPAAFAAKKEKAAKEKKAIEWTMPELTGIAEIDNYLLAVDTLYNELSELDDMVPSYSVRVFKDPDTGEEGLWVADANNNPRTAGDAVAQYAAAGLLVSRILINMTNITAMGATAGMAINTEYIKKNPLGIGKYNKAIKVGAQLVADNGVRLKDMVVQFKEQKKAIREYKRNVNEVTGHPKDASISTDACAAAIGVDAEDKIVMSSEQKEELKKVSENASDIDIFGDEDEEEA